ncbi:kelch-like protein 1 [Paramacrobiotus metropolitanus]|uniref:kelch-like protein 1 n=1 Tax=Paramacrobiotus metropolitanus TaxID=2943436 RepID=UPI002445F303|nr:kelch-like protein 1 [Paramacrobiotus metropolitanus]
MSISKTNRTKTSRSKTEPPPSKPTATFSSSESENGGEDVVPEAASTADTISLKSLDGVTLHPDSYQSPDEKSVGVNWVLVGQPDSPAKDDTETLHVVSQRHDSIFSIAEPPELDLDRQKICSRLHIQKRIKYIKKALESMELCDLSFLFGRSATPAHAMMFKAHSEFCSRFPELCPKNPGDVKKPLQLDLYGEISPTAFRAVMDYVYEGQSEVPYEYLAEIIAAGEFFGLTTLNEEIQESVEDLLCDDHLFPIIFHGDCDHPVKELAWVKLLDRISVLLEKGDFVALELAEMCQIMSSDGLNLPTEYDVLKACYQWVNADRPTRLIHFSRLMTCVRFHYMTPRELAKCQNKDPMFSTCKPVADTIALAYMARPFILENDTEFCERFELSAPRNSDILKHFTTFKEKSNGSCLITEPNIFPDSRKAVARVDTKYVRDLPTIISGDGPDFGTLADVHEITEDAKPEANKAFIIRKDITAVQHSLTRTTADNLISRIPQEPTRQNSARSHCSSVANFSQMTFNENGSLITKNGGKDTYKILSEAFDRIYTK